MTHNELLDKINILGHTSCWVALRAVVELHKPVEHVEGTWCSGCMATEWYPCPTIQTIKKELS